MSNAVLPYQGGKKMVFITHWHAGPRTFPRASVQHHIQTAALEALPSALHGKISKNSEPTRGLARPYGHCAT